MRWRSARQATFLGVALTGLLAGNVRAEDKAETSLAGKEKSHTGNRLQGEQMTVHGHRSSTVASSATKTNTPLVDTAQSVSVITRNEMDARGVLNLNQALRYEAGITADQRGGSVTRYDLFALRGFTVPVFLDGLKLQSSPTGYATAQTDTSRLERIEVLKGPSSALYGQSSPGGLVALSSKLPLDLRNYGNVTATGGSFDLWRVDADMGGYANRDGTIRYRLYGTANGQHSQLSRTANQRFSISPSITIGGNGPTTLTLLGNYQYDPRNASYGAFPLEGSLKRASFGYLPRSFYDGDLGFEKFKRYQGALTYIFTQKINRNWTLTSRGRYDNVRTLYESIYSAGYYTAPDEIGRGSAYSHERLQNLAFDTQLHGHYDMGAIHHDIMTGFDYQQSHATETAGFGAAPSLNIFHPDYYQVIPAIPASFMSNYLTKSQQYGVYGQDEIQLGQHVFLTGSIRNDWFRSRQYQNTSTTTQSPDQLTWRASGLYHFDFGLSPYISYSTSFEPQTGLVKTDGNVKQAAPSLGKQLEGGAKYQIPGTPVLLTAAGFHIEQTNVLVPIGTTGFNTQSGKVHSDGFEFEAHVDAYKGLMVTAAFSTQRVRDDSTGKPLVQSGRGNASLFALYTLPDTILRGFGVGGGLRYSASVYGGPAVNGDTKVPSYTLFDGFARYDLGKLSPRLRGWTATASVRNIFDRHYVSNCYAFGASGGWCWYGERRNAQASIGYSW